jgi:hypothetical protein
MNIKIVKIYSCNECNYFIERGIEQQESNGFCMTLRKSFAYITGNEIPDWCPLQDAREE